MYVAQLVMVWSLAVGMALAVLIAIAYIVCMVTLDYLDARDAKRTRARMAKLQINSQYGKWPHL